MAFLLALALVVSVMSGLGLSVSAEQESNTPGTEEVQQQDKTEAGAAPSEVKAEEEAAKPEEKPVQEEKEGEQKTEAKENADKPAEKQEKATPKAGENVQTATIGTGDKTVTVKTTAAAGVLPEGAKLVVKKLANQDQAYQDAESTLKDSQVTYDDFLALDVGFEVNGKEALFELQDKETKVFTDVKYGTKFTVSENDYSDDGYTTSYKVDDGDETDGRACTTTVTAPTTITFTNTKTIQPPNGITTTIAPYAIMVVLAAGAGVYFVYSRRRCNR